MKLKGKKPSTNLLTYNLCIMGTWRESPGSFCKLSPSSSALALNSERQERHIYEQQLVHWPTDQENSSMNVKLVINSSELKLLNKTQTYLLCVNNLMSWKWNEPTPETVAQHQRLHSILMGPLAAHRGSRWSDAKKKKKHAALSQRTYMNDRVETCMQWTSKRGSHHVYSFIDHNVLDLAHLNKCGCFPAWGVAGRYLDPQGADDKQRLVVHLHKVDVQHHANQGDEYSCRQDGSVL